ncbi:MAG: DUF2079 domain-containing protein, partial [bacterium]|nr:DUF2079 domain-containing protein [bacterium]
KKYVERSADSPPPTIAKVSMEEQSGRRRRETAALGCRCSGRGNAEGSLAETDCLPRHRSVSPEGNGGTLSRTPLLLALLWLANPLTQNINLFEFHILPFALFPLFYALLAYEEKRMGKFVLWSLLALTVREDVALVIGAFALLGLYDMVKKKVMGDTLQDPRSNTTLGVASTPSVSVASPLNRMQWIFVPLLLSSIWFIAAQKIAAHFASGGAYKFLYYYAWLGNSFPDILFNIFRHPLIVFAHIATGNTALLFLALGMPFLFLFLARPRALLLTIPILLQNLLANYGATPLIAETHYVTLLLPGLVLATIMALASPPKFFAAFPIRFLLIVATLYGMATLGPLPGIAMERTPPQELQARAFFIKQIPVDAHVATTESFLTSLSRRNELYLLRYAVTGKTQFGKTPYALPSDVAYILIDTDDLIAYPQEDVTRFHDLLAPFGVIAAQERFFLLQRGKGVPFFDATKQKALEAQSINESPCSVPPLTRCVRLTVTQQSDNNVFLLNDDTTQPFPLSLPTYWFPETTPITSVAAGNATSVITLVRDRSTMYQWEITDRRNLQISRQ